MRYIDLTHLEPAPRPAGRPQFGPPKRHRGFKTVLKAAAVFAAVFIAFVGGYWSYLGYQTVSFIFSSTGQSLSNTLNQQSQSGNGGEENLLLLGSDNDQKFSGNPLTQTMMVVHIDYGAKRITMFSIPRDLWVKMPGSNHYGKIDEASGYGGLPDAVKVVQQNFGIQIQHYAWVGLYGFVKGVNDVGGVNLDVLHPVLDNAYPTDITSPDNPYGYMRLLIPAGMQHLDGETALEYVRSRHEDLIGDFGRTERQRQLLLSLKEELLSANLLDQAPQILADLQGQVKTDLSPIDLTQLGQFTSDKSVKIDQVSLNPPATHNATSVGGQSIVVGDPTAVSQAVGQIFGDQAAETTFTSLSDQEGVAK